MSLSFIQKSYPEENSGSVQNEIVGIDSLKSPSGQKRIPELDGLRGIAVLMVISFHYINNQLVNSTSYLGKILYKLTSLRWVGVDLIFVLSIIFSWITCRKLESHFVLIGKKFRY